MPIESDRQELLRVHGELIVAAKKRVRCTKPWTSLEERENRDTRVPDDMATCCWIVPRYGRAQTGPEVFARFNSDGAQKIRTAFAKGTDGPAMCHETCPIVNDRDRWFEKLEFYTYSPEELASFDARFVENRVRALRAIVEGRVDVETRPLRLKVFPSNDCNLRCNMCMVNFEERYERDWYDGPELADAMPYLEELLVFGAEPFLCRTSKRMLTEPVPYPQIHYSFITNGTLVTQRVIDALTGKRLGAVDVSLDSHTKETYETIRIRGKWENALRGARLLAGLGRTHPIRRFDVFANFAIQDRNYSEVESFVSFCADEGLLANFSVAFPTQASAVRHEKYGNDVARLPQDPAAFFAQMDKAIAKAQQLDQQIAAQSLMRALAWARDALAPRRVRLPFFQSRR